jgi:HD-GYP domain-containing protein (c-di-GMP phosphodiesterase class II)
MPAQAARDELLRHRGTQFDAAVVDALLRALKLADNLAVESHASFASVG